MDERDELNSKREKLAAFIDHSPIYTALPEHEKEILLRQIACMTEYHAILNERILAFAL